MANLLYNLAQPFSDTKQYTQGTIVVYNDRMYEMTASDYTPGAFNSEKFTERFLSEMISGKLNSNLDKDAEFLAFNTASPYKGRLLLIIATNIAGTINYTVAGTTYTKTFGANVTYSEWHSVEIGDTITLVSATIDAIKTISAILLH